MVVWFAGLFYLVRLFIYHVETAELAPELQQPFRDQYALMEKRLANIITTPGMVVAVSMAIGLLVMQPSWLHQSWMHAKLGFVAALLAYHLLCYRLMGQLQSGSCQWSGKSVARPQRTPHPAAGDCGDAGGLQDPVPHQCGHLVHRRIGGVHGSLDSVLCPLAESARRSRCRDLRCQTALITL